MIRNFFFLLVLLTTCSGAGMAQEQAQKYWVFFTDKEGVVFDPHAYFDDKAIARRIKHDLPLDHVTDRPVRTDYIDQVSIQVDSVKMISRWFNGMVCWANAAQMESVSEFSFVKKVEALRQPLVNFAGYPSLPEDLTADDKSLLTGQIARFGDGFKEQNIDGRGVRVAIFDAGFPMVDQSPAFEHLRSSGRIGKTYDFVKNKEFVYSFNTHGTMVLSCVAGIIDGQPSGLATGAEFILARTETWTELIGEEENWLAAAEWADKEGADIINSSLGYTYHRYFKGQMDGHTALVSRAANMAAGKGILVVNAAGNDGGDDWHVVGAPADADSVLSVGGINPWTGYHTSFSSFGPTADGRKKPNISAYGHVIAEGKKGPSETQGTSFASPLMAGFAACVLQANPELKCMELFDRIQKAGDLYPYYDYAHGYGVPLASNILNVDHQEAPQFSLEETEGLISVAFADSITSQDVEVYDNWPTDIMFYHIEDANGHLTKYRVRIRPVESLPIVQRKEFPGAILRVYYRGAVIEQKL